MKKVIVLSINTSWNLINFRRDLITRLQREGFEVVALSPIDDYVPALTALGVRHVPIAIDSKGLSPKRDLILMVSYWRALKKIRPVAFLGWTIKPNIYGSLAAYALRIPVINNISGLGTAFIKVNLLTIIVKTLYRAALFRSATVFFQNPHDRCLFISEGIVVRDQAILLPGSGVDLRHFAPKESLPTSSFVFLMVARLLRDKGVVEFVEAAIIVRRTYPHVQFHLLGATDVENRSAIPRHVLQKWENDGTILHLGEANDVRPHLAAASVVVLPSYREGMPRALLEAAAMAKPLIATDVPGCTEIARPGENAILCKVRDAASLAEAMLAMLALSPEARKRMSLRSREIAEHEFDVSVVEAHYIAAITRVLAASATE